MTVVVCAPYINKSCKSSVKFILVISNVGGKVGRIAVFTNKYIVLKLKVVNVFLSFALL